MIQFVKIHAPNGQVFITKLVVEEVYRWEEDVYSQLEATGVERDWVEFMHEKEGRKSEFQFIEKTTTSLIELVQKGKYHYVVSEN